VISFRYHLVSIVSVFLALALGVLVGTTVVNQGLIQDLEGRTDDAVARAREREQELVQLQDEIRVRDRIAQAVEPLLIQDRLSGREIVMVTLEGVDASDVDGVRRALEGSGASVVAEMVVTARMGLPDEGARSDLAAAIGLPDSTDVEELSQAAAERLGTRLGSGPDATDPDLLDQLATGGFVDVQGAAPFAEIGGVDQAVVLLAGGKGVPMVDPSVLATMAQTLALAVQPVVAAETLDSEYPFVQLVREDGSVDGTLVTVDNADQMPGRVAIVLGLQSLLLSPGRGGDYGVKDGASDLFPHP
jgi:hypothetical protein